MLFKNKRSEIVPIFIIIVFYSSNFPLEVYATGEHSVSVFNKNPFRNAHHRELEEL